MSEKKVQSFEDLKVWQKAHTITLEIYKVTQKFPAEEKFGLISQIRRSASSVAANIVEGFRKKSLRDSLNFYTIADASLEELKYHLLLSRDLEYIKEGEYQNILGLCEEVGKLLTRWIQSQRNYLK